MEGGFLALSGPTVCSIRKVLTSIERMTVRFRLARVSNGIPRAVFSVTPPIDLGEPFLHA